MHKRLFRAGRLGALTVVPVALLLSSCSSSPSSSDAARRSTTTSSPTTTSSTTTSTSSTTTTTQPPTTVATLSVVPCQTALAITTPPPAAHLPATLAVTVPADQASNLTVYSDAAGQLTLIGPKGWVCRAEYGTDGGGGVVITPVGESIQKIPGSRGHVASLSNAEAIEGYQTGTNVADGAALACPVIPAAAADTATDARRDCAHPKGETLLPKTRNEVAFYDPPGVAGEGAPSGGLVPASGVVLYLPGKGKATAYVATCALPAVQSEICYSVLNDFVARYG